MSLELVVQSSVVPVVSAGTESIAATQAAQRHATRAIDAICSADMNVHIVEVTLSELL